VIAWEVASRYCRAAPGWLFMKVHLCPPSWFGTVGVAAAGAKLLKMNANQTEHALCIAGSYSSGLGQAGCDTHFLESGHTSRMGLQSAILANMGATGELGILEKPQCFYAPVWSEGKVNLEIIDADLGKPPYLINQACIKKYSACTFAHTSIDALGLIMKEHAIAYDEVEYAETQVSELARMAVGTHPEPADLQQARFSLQYLMGEVLLRGRVDVHSFVGEEKLSDPKHKEAESKIRVSLLPGLPYEVPAAQVTLVKKNGQKLVKRLDGWIGSPQYPLSIEQVREVCRPYLEVMLDKAQCDRVEELVLNLEKQPDILELMNILTFSRVGHRA
jgi:2-methylcitrate dehydratase PrpD